MGFFFAGLCVIGAIIIFIEIPEMKNRTYAELDEMFKRRIPTRQFSTYVSESMVVEKKEQA
jgi:MFS transporter, SP family, general alpha glucoside:H+ symporter